MKQYISAILIIFNLLTSYSQNEKNSSPKDGKNTSLIFEDGIFNNQIYLNYKISNTWAFATGVESMYNFDVKGIAIPVKLKVKLSENVEIFADHLWYFSENNNFLTDKLFYGSGTKIGGRYYFTNETNVKVFFFQNHDAKRNLNSALFDTKNNLNFNFSFRF